jgi:hypothetical protein
MTANTRTHKNISDYRNSLKFYDILEHAKVIEFYYILALSRAFLNSLEYSLLFKNIPEYSWTFLKHCGTFKNIPEQSRIVKKVPENS